jgi:dTDP-4-dehydrorhamnose 3,5-epimerase
VRFESIAIDDAGILSIERIPDQRGFFARVFCAREFSEFGLPVEFVQSSLSVNDYKGTIRGMHFQWPPSRECKILRCVRGHILDVLLDLRPDSHTYLSHAVVELSAENRDAVFVPAGVAHGFQTLEDGTEVLYQMTDYHAPELAGGFRWNDPAFGIDWPLTVCVMSERDRNCPDFDRYAFEAELHRRSSLDPDPGERYAGST